MRVHAIAAMMMAALMTPASADPGDQIIKSEDGLDFVIPAGSPVTLNAKGFYAEFSFAGGFALRGTFTYGYVDTGSADDIVTTFAFVPDSASVRNLPHWPGELAGKIGFSNEEEFLQAVVPQAQLAALGARRQGTVSGRVTVRADSWHAILGCGDAYYHARFVKASSRVRMIAPRPAPDQPDC